MKALISFPIILLFILPLHAQVSLSSEVKQAIRQALQHDATLHNQHLELKKMELQRKSVLSMYIPKVEARALYAHFNTDVTVDLPTQTVDLPIAGGSQVDFFEGKAQMDNYGNIFHGGLTAKAVLFSGGQIIHGAKALEEKNKGTRLMLALGADSLIQEVITSYDQLQLLLQAKGLIDASSRRLDKETRRVEEAIKAGLAIPYDRDKIKLAQLELESKRRDINHKQQLLALKIAQQTGLDTAQILHTPHQVEPILLQDSLNTSKRKEVQALEHFKQASRYNIKKEKGRFLPSIGAFGGYAYSSLFDAEAGIPLSYMDRTAYLRLNQLTLQPTWTLGVGLQWEIFGGFQRKHKLQEAKLSLQQVENTLEDTREKVNLQLQKYTIELQNALDQVEISRQKEAIARHNNTLAQRQYQAGLISVTERLSSEDDLYKAGLDLLQQLVNQRKAALETLQASGNLSSSLHIN